VTGRNSLHLRQNLILQPGGVGDRRHFSRVGQDGMLKYSISWELHILVTGTRLRFDQTGYDREMDSWRDRAPRSLQLEAGTLVSWRDGGMER
jgi:hypothetical protein